MKNTIQNSEKEQWKDHVLSSLEGIKRAEAPPFLFTRIQASILLTNRNPYVSTPKLMLGVVAFLVLCCVNLWVLIESNQVASPNNVPPLQAAIMLESVNFDLY
ncbi:MAG: hypothetical protein H9535_05155 [Ignavibacteria bacterium]|nr:hypothetical protein [Ignavibacteria bacterium]